MSIYESEHCVVDVHRSDLSPRLRWFIGDEWEAYNSPTWPTKEAMIADLEAIVAVLRAARSGRMVDP